MSWRNLRKEDIKRGTVIRLGNIMNDGGYYNATIISVSEIDASDYPHFTVARPYAYANEHFNSKHPLMGSEVFAIGVKSALDPNSDIQVYQGRDGIRCMIT
jgi:hypothetical protein